MRQIAAKFVVLFFMSLPLLAMPMAAAAPLVTAGMLADGAVTRSKIAYGAVDGDRIADRTITLNKLATLTVLTANIGDGVITTSKLADKAVSPRKLRNKSITAKKLAVAAVNSAKIRDRSVRAKDLATGSVNAAKVANGSLTGIDIAAGAIAAANLAAGSVTGEKVADGSLTGADVADGGLSQADFPLALVGPDTGLRMESGETTISTASLGIQTRTIGFDANFVSPPLVFVSFKDFTDYVGTNANNLVVTATASSIDIKTKVVSGGTPGSYATVSWLAIGK